jgi:DNA-binding Lrp family transcriptional regulator
MSVSSRRLDDVDRRMLGILVDEGRMSVNELAARVNVSRATAYSRFERLRRDGVITGVRAG